jgi:hypothetical protein
LLTILTNIICTGARRLKHGRSSVIDLDKVAEVAEKNAKEAVKMLVYYLKLEKEKQR